MHHKSPVNEGELGAQYLTKFLSRSRAAVAYQAHNLGVVGSNPTSASKFEKNRQKVGTITGLPDAGTYIILPDLTYTGSVK